MRAQKYSPRFLTGLDLGRPQDHTAIAVLELTVEEERVPPYQFIRHYAVRHLHRLPPGTAYTEVVTMIRRMLAEPPLRNSSLLVDQTGVGQPVYDLFRQARLPVTMRPVTISAGYVSRQAEKGGWLVPRSELASTIQALLQTRRLCMAASLPEAPVLVQELTEFRIKVPTSINDDALAWREGARDDLVLAVAIAAWLGERIPVATRAPMMLGGGWWARP